MNDSQIDCMTERELVVWLTNCAVAVQRSEESLTRQKVFIVERAYDNLKQIQHANKLLRTFIPLPPQEPLVPLEEERAETVNPFRRE